MNRKMLNEVFKRMVIVTLGFIVLLYSHYCIGGLTEALFAAFLAGYCLQSIYRISQIRQILNGHLKTPLTRSAVNIPANHPEIRQTTTPTHGCAPNQCTTIVKARNRMAIMYRIHNSRKLFSRVFLSCSVVITPPLKHLWMGVYHSVKRWSTKWKRYLLYDG
jgi:hypothetical protein